MSFPRVTHYFIGFIGLVIYNNIAFASSALTIDNIKAYGIYVKGNHGYVKLKSLQHQNMRYIDYKYYGEIPYVTRNDNQLELLVYQKDFSGQSIGFEIRPMSLVASNTQIFFDITPTDKKDMYLLSYDKPIPAATVLQVTQGSWYTFAVAGIALGDPQKELVPIFSNMNQEAYVVLPSVQDAISAFPNNKKFKALLPKWQQLRKTEKDKTDYSYVDTAWRKYKNTPKLTLQKRYLLSVIREINGYLKNHPDGSMTKQAAARRTTAEKRLKEIAKQL